MTASTLEQGDTVPALEDAHLDASTESGEASVARPDNSLEALQELPRAPSIRRHPFGALVWFLKACLGLLSLVALLALAAAIPVANVFALGYLMEVQARVARTGKFGSAAYLLPVAGRLAGIVLGVTLWLLPIQFLSGAARDSWLLAPGGSVTWLWTAGLVGASLLIAAHLLMAIGCGGSWSRFVRPLNNIRHLRNQWRGGEYLRNAHRALRDFLAAMRLPHLFSLGLIGYAATYVWLVVPTYLFTMLDDVTSRFQIFGFIVGCILLTISLMWLPLLLAHVASEGRWQAMFEMSRVTRLAGQTPFRWAIATAILLACSILPMLYETLLKNQIPPHAARWDLMLVFLVTVGPARVLVGWVYHRATQPSRCVSFWSGRLWQCVNGAALAIGIGWYVYFLYLAETGGELGQIAVWQFPALLLPAPF